MRNSILIPIPNLKFCFYFSYDPFYRLTQFYNRIVIWLKFKILNTYLKSEKKNPPKLQSSWKLQFDSCLVKLIVEKISLTRLWLRVRIDNLGAANSSRGTKLENVNQRLMYVYNSCAAYNNYTIITIFAAVRLRTD